MWLEGAVKSSLALPLNLSSVRQSKCTVEGIRSVVRPAAERGQGHRGSFQCPCLCHYTVMVTARPGRSAWRSACVDQRVFMPERLSEVRLSLSLTTLSSQCMLWRTVRSSARHCHRFKLLHEAHALTNSCSLHTTRTHDVTRHTLYYSRLLEQGGESSRPPYAP